MGVMGAPTFNPAQPTIAPPPPPPPPAPSPPPPPPPPTRTYKNPDIPRGQFGNRLDTEAGRKKEAEMAAAAHALKVAHSEAVHGRPDSAKEALQKALDHTNKANVTPAGEFQNAVIRDYNNITKIIDSNRSAPAPTPAAPKPIVPESKITASARPAAAPSTGTSKAVKNPTRDILNLEPMLRDPSEIAFILFNQLGATELINLVRNDTVSGKNILYSPISDLEKNEINFDASVILTNKASYQSIFNGFQIKLDEKIPEESKYNLNDDEYFPENNLLTNAYWDGENLVIEIENLRPTELLQIELESDGKIYKVRENDNQ